MARTLLGESVSETYRDLLAQVCRSRLVGGDTCAARQVNYCTVSEINLERTKQWAIEMHEAERKRSLRKRKSRWRISQRGPRLSTSRRPRPRRRNPPNRRSLRLSRAAERAHTSFSAASISNGVRGRSVSLASAYFVR